MPTLAAVLRDLRNRRGLAIVDVVAALKISRATLYAWESEAAIGYPPPITQMQALLDHYGATPAERQEVAEAIVAPRFVDAADSPTP